MSGFWKTLAKLFGFSEEEHPAPPVPKEEKVNPVYQVVDMARIIPGDTDIEIVMEATSLSPQWMKDSPPEVKARVSAMMHAHVIPLLRKGEAVAIKLDGVAFGSWFLARMAYELAIVFVDEGIESTRVLIVCNEDPSLATEMREYIIESCELRELAN